MSDLLESFPDRPYRLRFIERVWASLLDIVILLAVFIAFLLIFVSTDLSSYDNGLVMQELKDKFTPFANLVLVGFTLLELFTGRTPAKYFLGIGIGDLWGRPVSITVLMKRGLVKVGMTTTTVLASHYEAMDTLATFVTLGFFIGCLLALSYDRQAAHDKFAQTAVYHVEDMR